MDFDAALARYDEVRAAAYSLKMAAVNGADDFRASACILRNGAALLKQGAAHDIRRHNDERGDIAKLLMDAAIELVLAAMNDAVDQTHAKGAPAQSGAPLTSSVGLSVEAA